MALCDVFGTSGAAKCEQRHDGTAKHTPTYFRDTLPLSRRDPELSRKSDHVLSGMGLRGLVDLTAEESNLLFQVLEEWERHLAHLDLDGLERDHDETDT